MSNTLRSTRTILLTFLVTFLLTVLTILPLFSTSALADWQMMPESRHQLYQSYANFIDEQCTLVWRGERRAWGAIGGTIALYGNPDSETHPQFVFHSSANASMHWDPNFRIFTQTVDARFGGAYEFALSPSTRLSLGLNHNSGHSSEGVLDLGDQDLLVINLGQENGIFRLVHDLNNSVRLGVTFKPYLKSFPGMLFFAADQFVEYFPWGAQDIPSRPSPYVALGLEQQGSSRLINTIHIQLGAYFGNHFSKKFHQTLRPVLGYYNGADPRLKYFQFQERRMETAYIGFMFDI